MAFLGTYEKIEDEEEEVYETVNIYKLKQHMPNLRVVNFWGVSSHTEAQISRQQLQYHAF